MDVIIYVLNRIFDENDKIYIGNYSDFINIYNKTNDVLKNINRHTTYATRKNKGSTMFRERFNLPITNVNHIKGTPYRKTRRSRIKKYEDLIKNNLNNYNINLL